MIGPRDDPAAIGRMILSRRELHPTVSVLRFADDLAVEAAAAAASGLRLIPLYEDTRPPGPICGLPVRNGHVNRLPEEA